MAQSKIIEGTWDELAVHADELRIYPKLTLIVPPEEATQDQASLEDHEREVEQFRKQGLRGVGMFAHVPGGSEAFALEKQEEIEREDRPL